MHLFSFSKPFYDLYICTSPRNLHKLLVVLFSHLTPMTSCHQLSDYHCVSLMPRPHPLIIRNVSGNSWALSWLGRVSSLIYRTALYQVSIFSLWNNAMWYRHVINGLSLDCWQPKTIQLSPDTPTYIAATILMRFRYHNIQQGLYTLSTVFTACSTTIGGLKDGWWPNISLASFCFMVC